MALTSVPTSVSSATQKQLVFNVNNSGSVLYTVPAGKTFIGYFTGNGTNAYIQINSVQVFSTSGTAGYAALLIPLTLIAGTVLSGGSYAGAVWGIEQ